MNLFMAVLAILVADRAIPNGWMKFSFGSLKRSRQEIWDRYKLVAFPRTAFGVAVCLAAGANIVVPIDSEIQGWTMVIFGAAFAMSASIDTWRAGLGGPGQ